MDVITTLSIYDTMNNAIRLSVFMLSVAFPYCYAECSNAQGQYTECHYVKCQYSECRDAE